MNEIMGTIKMFIEKKGPMSEDEIISEFGGLCEESQIRHAIKEMALGGHIHYDADRKINLVE